MKNNTLRQPAAETTDLPHQRFDIVAKDVIHAFPEDMLAFLIRDCDIEFVEHLESELMTVEARQMDSLMKVMLDGEQVLVHCEFQTTDSTHAEMPRRNFGYLGRCYERYGLPICSHVIYLRPNAGRNDPGRYVQDIAGYPIIVGYKVIRLIEVEGQSVLEAQQPGLLPFCPLMKPPEGIDALTWLNQCVETTKSLSLDAPIRNNLLLDMWVMGGLVHDSDAIAHLFPEDIMQESSVYQDITQRARAEGIELGAKANAIENILQILEIRFQASATSVKPGLEAIDDTQRLKALHREAVETPTLAAFIEKL